MTRRTFADYKNEVLHALGNPDEADLAIVPGTIVNDALEAIAAMHEWRWKQAGEVRLDLTKDQDHVELPADFGMVTAVHFDNSWVGYFEPTTWDRLLWLRQQPIKSWHTGFMYVVDIGNVADGSPEAGLDVPTLNLYPTPSDDRTDAIRLAYIRRLRRLEADTDQPQWPPYMDRPCSLLARTMATIDHDDQTGRHYEMQFQRLVNDAMAHDGLATGSFGQVKGGLFPRRHVPWGYPDQGIPDPQQV